MVVEAVGAEHDRAADLQIAVAIDVRKRHRRRVALAEHRQQHRLVDEAELQKGPAGLHLRRVGVHEGAHAVAAAVGGLVGAKAELDVAVAVHVPHRHAGDGPTAFDPAQAGVADVERKGAPVGALAVHDVEARVHARRDDLHGAVAVEVKQRRRAHEAVVVGV